MKPKLYWYWYWLFGKFIHRLSFCFKVPINSIFHRAEEKCLMRSGLVHLLDRLCSLSNCWSDSANSETQTTKQKVSVDSNQRIWSVYQYLFYSKDSIGLNSLESDHFSFVNFRLIIGPKGVGVTLPILRQPSRRYLPWRGRGSKFWLADTWNGNYKMTVSTGILIFLCCPIMTSGSNHA